MDIANPLFAYLIAFSGGLVAAVSPCSLMAYPLIIGYVGGYSDGDIKRSLLYSLMFLLGLATTFTLLGLIAAITGSLLGKVGWYWKYILALVALVMGLNLLGVLKFNFPAARFRQIEQKGVLGAYIIGLIYGVSSSPCSTPILAFLLTYVASKQNLFYGATLLFAYSLAYYVIVLILGISIGVAQYVLKSHKIQKSVYYFHRLSGVILVLTGVYLLLLHR
jgi:cytochrome c biogenesis protein CcdA